MTMSEKFLSKEDMLRLELEAEKEKVRKLTENIILEENKYLQKCKEVIQKDMELISHRFSNIREINNKDRNNRAEFMAGLKSKYEVPEDEGLGYDPDTGKLIVNNE